MNRQTTNEDEEKKEVVELSPNSTDTGDVEAVAGQKRVESKSLMQSLPELTPEQIEVIMDKVQDIDGDGTAFSVVHRDSDIFNDGILGTAVIEDDRPWDHIPTSREEWAAQRKKGDAAVHFNIVGRRTTLPRGRDRFKNGGKGDINCSEFMERGGLSVIFDTSTMDELLPVREKDGEQKSGTFQGGFGFDCPYPTHLTDELESLPDDTRVKDPRVQEVLEDISERTDIPVDCVITQPCDFGFLAYHRIHPNKLRGLVMCPRRKSYTEIEAPHINELACLIRCMIDKCKNRPDRLLPVYDVSGNLLWPKQMSYEQVKEFVARCDNNRDKE